jgi:tetratricopeptide (TPR) repeat protein
MRVRGVALLLIAVATWSANGQSEKGCALGCLNQAYEALRSRAYDAAIEAFRQAIALEPDSARIRKELAYTLLKVGRPTEAREAFAEAMRLDPADVQPALEYAFVCYEATEDAVTWKAVARRTFDRLRKEGSATAEEAFQNIDRPLAEGIERWTRALEVGTESFSAHYELARLAEQRDELELAARHYLRAWQLMPARKSVLVDLGRVLLRAGKFEEGRAVLLAASRGGETRAAELARELLPDRYPYVYEFRAALQTDPGSVELRRELAYLLLKMAENLEGDEKEARQREAEEEFRVIVASQADDLWSSAQLGFLYLARGEIEKARPLLQKAANGSDRDLANRVRTALHWDPALEKEHVEESAGEDTNGDARLMGEKSYAAGYMKDAVRYLTVAHEADPHDYGVMLKLGYTENVLHNDVAAMQWFAMAKSSPDSAIAARAKRAYSNLRPNLARVRTTGWIYPFYSTRWSDTFGYGQVKTEFRMKRIPVHPYVSVRFVGDTREKTGGAMPQSLSESSFILGTGLATDAWHGVVGWGEVGTAVSYLGQPRKSDVRGGAAWAKLWGASLLSEANGPFVEADADCVFVSRFGNDWLAVSQNKAGYTLPGMGPVRLQLLLNANVTQDSLRQYWANFGESGPGVRWRFKGSPASLSFSVNWLRGVYTRNVGNPRGPNFWDLRMGFWYAFTR